MNHKIYSWYLMDQHLLFLKESAKVMKHQQDSWVISETRSLMINTSKCEGRSRDYWRYSMYEPPFKINRFNKFRSSILVVDIKQIRVSEVL